MQKTISFFLFLGLFLVQAKAQSLKVMSYNIRYDNPADGVNQWPNRIGRIDTLLHKNLPHVLCVQEALNHQILDLLTLEKNYHYIGVGRDDGKTKGEFSPILFDTHKLKLLANGHFWLSPWPDSIGSKGWDAAITRICTWGKFNHKASGKVFFVFNTHFDHMGIVAREESAKLTLRKMHEIAGNAAIILAGDFNSEPNSEGYQNIVSNKLHALKDTYVAGELLCTFKGFEVNSNICKRIDFIFYDEHFRQKQFKIRNDHNGVYFPSDHLPVETELEFK